MLMPPPLRPGDKVRFVSPASSPDRDMVLRHAEILKGWGLNVDFGEHAFSKWSYLAGTDEERLADLNAAFRDPKVRAIFTTRGGKGSYRIADQVDFAAVRRDPKFVIGFSDITALHLSLLKHCHQVGIHGAFSMGPNEDGVSSYTHDALRQALMTTEDVVIAARPEEPTSRLTTSGTAEGRLIGGNLDMVAASAGWALPDMHGAILLLEATGLYPGQVDRQMTMLQKAGHLYGLLGVAIGQFTNFEFDRSYSVIDILREHLAELKVPILGGLPLGHGDRPASAFIGAIAELDAKAGILAIRCGNT
ncbi:MULTISPECIES: LD-carboxypeptidase [unclassified Rhizobium]|uniref:S66 peptidase family protein n=1 Tax=unclassified Rhizobium TaxID=2613769 RepID=UPI0017AEC8AE|nr:MULTISPECIES: LD-carboxypeptidase [unclassified Rhizobium]MBB3381598.1 muramoyltetrapeptide carboxypeptidase [Rhizobium sp. BK098]MBB3613300.1 muramoyltetrapeptide carboxypeptidase [Rhizobium sp. BK609]MBB3678958.1 muramoyltetrapeptide carboxypeptidase [Rhizobium sp. BK612]